MLTRKLKVGDRAWVGERSERKLYEVKHFYNGHEAIPVCAPVDGKGGTTLFIQYFSDEHGNLKEYNALANHEEDGF